MSDKKGTPSGKRATMTDVAKRAGVSQATVSLVLNNAGGVRVNDETRERVQKAADDLGYTIWRRTRVGAGSIRIIGFLIDDIASSPLTTASIEAARQAAWENGCVLVVLPIHGETALERAAIKLLLDQRLVGVIYACFYTKKVVLPKALRTVPVVLVNCFSSDINLLAFVPSHEAGAYHITASLIARGHRRIAYINGKSDMLASQQRLQGYRRAMSDHDVPIDETLVAEGSWSLSQAQALTSDFLHLSQPPDAIFCASDRMALGAYAAAAAANLRIPDDIAVVGFDNDPIAAHLSPPLTTVHVPHAGMGQIAVQQLVSRYEGRMQGLLTGMIPLDCVLVERASHAKSPL
jgi:LacI family transcriptional regulator